VAACLALAACSSQGVSGQTPARSAQSGPRITVDMVTHGQAFDPFWALVQKGAQAAAKDFNVNLVYHSPSPPIRRPRRRSSTRPPRGTRRGWW
jgi:ABC-type sugar transport system, periplasmic component